MRIEPPLPRQLLQGMERAARPLQGRAATRLVEARRGCLHDRHLRVHARLHSATQRPISAAAPDRGMRGVTCGYVMVPTGRCSEDVAERLSTLGLSQYAPAFRDNDIDGRVLRQLTAEDLRHFGVASVGHRRLLLDAIAALSETKPSRRRGSAAQVSEARFG
jgi:hypothetical protein